MKVLCVLIFSILSSVTWADEVKNLAELALLPSYCKGTQTIRQLSKDPTPTEQYVSVYGHAFTHLHHYCWALNSENNASRLSLKSRRVKLTYSLEDYKYFLDRAPSSFILLPEIYTSRARVFFVLERDGDAVKDLYTAIELNAEYSLAYAKLSGYYQKINDKSNAIKILEQGLDNTKNPRNIKFLIGELEQLGKNYSGTPGNALPKKDESTQDKYPSEINETMESDNTQSNSAINTPLLPAPATGNTTLDRTDLDSSENQQANPNPYCRFCP